ncbi:MAG: AAA family ATPase [Streptosporangiaceae bacterium]
MRPIALDMDGFASFREPTRVDFSDAEFFALVGPTGSGKSTIIDAMTFALFGSVPRWGRKGMVSLALAPTISRGTVKLVFEVAGQRYVVARELRRIGSQVSQRAASLERLTDPHGLAQPGDPTELLAKDLSGVNETVERMLGLSYEDFCQCVVLPQGQFANFLHAKASDRQEILLRLLGAEHYRQMMMRANQRAAVAGQRADALAETLVTLADATPEAEEAARDAETALAALGQRVETALPRIRAGVEELSAAEDGLRQLETERASLAAISIPEEVAGLDSDLAGSRAAAGKYRDAERLAEGADRAAREALARGPQRAPLELARDRRAERSERVPRRLALQENAARLAATSGEASAMVETAAASLEELRGQRDEAARDSEAARQRVDRIGTEHAALAAVSVPDEASRLDQQRRAAADAVTAAERALREAEQADTAARGARDSAAAEAALQHASRDVRDLHDLIAELESARLGLERAHSGQSAAVSALASAEDLRRECQRTMDEVRRAHVIADLRPHLVAGRPCPLCEQTVETFPAAPHAPEIDDAAAQLNKAEQAVQDAREKAKAADLAAAKAEAELKSLADRRTRLATALAGALVGPLAGAGLTALPALLEGEADAALAGVIDEHLVTGALTELGTSLHARHELDQAADEAAAAVGATRATLSSAQMKAGQAEADMAAACAALRAARDPLVGLGAPHVDDAALAAGWATLAEWASGQATARAAELADARGAAAAAAERHEKLAADFSKDELNLARLREEAKRAALAEQEARTQLAQLAERIAELDRLLQDAPDETQLIERLAVRDRLEASAADAEGELLKARSDRAESETALAALEQAESDAMARLSAVRDRVVALGAPALDGAGLLDGWTALATWAAREARSRDQDITAASATAATARANLNGLTGQLTDDLAAAGIGLAPETAAAGASSAVAGAVERARAATQRIMERRAQAAELTSRQQDAQDDQRVARFLGDLLRSDRFPRWLVTEAVDVLVADASANLAALSSGQFDLTYEDGDFYVVDHTDADARRSVRTLSGGETFQASLALALALSSQISALAAAGAARLDSIFLDEGFGTLDPDTLDVVATTLETLAQGQRMVGVVTHVAALAERVPVRFKVSRDARTSSVMREGLTNEAAAI